MSGSITGISSMATRAILAELGRMFEAAGGEAVAIESVGGVDAARRVRAGEAIDVVILAGTVMEKLEAEGHLVPGSRAGIALSRIAVAVPSGRPQPSLQDEQAVREAILAAGRVCYSTGPSGDHLKGLLERWGIAAQMADRLLQAPPGVPVGSLLARGEADLGIQQLSELKDVAGIDVVGTLPPAIESVTTFTAGIAATAPDPGAARALIRYLASAETAEVKRRHGMEPA